MWAFGGDGVYIKIISKFLLGEGCDTEEEFNTLSCQDPTSLQHRQSVSSETL